MPLSFRRQARILETRADAMSSQTVHRLTEELRADADAFVFLSGGASNMVPRDQERLFSLFDGLVSLAATGLRFAVGDGGTKAGIMEAAGRARERAGYSFPLVGVAPADEILPVDAEGRTPIDPNHSHIVAVSNPKWLEDQKRQGWQPEWGLWGSEIEAMYDLFGRLAEGRPSVALVANGGGITLSEVEANIRQSRRVLVVSGSGRAADALVACLSDTVPEAEPAAELYPQAKEIVSGHESSFEVFDVGRGAAALADVLTHELAAR